MPTPMLRRNCFSKPLTPLSAPWNSMSASTKSVARHTLPSHAATPGFCPQLAQNLVLSMKFTLSIAEGKETDSFPIFLIFWPSFSLAVLYIMLKRFPSQTRHNSAVNRHFTQTRFLAQIWCKKRHFLSSRPTICPSARLPVCPHVPMSICPYVQPSPALSQMERRT